MVPVHVIGVYLPPYKQPIVKQTLNRLKHLICSLFNRVKQSRVVIAGDFNFWISEFRAFMLEYGIKGCIPENIETHDSGN
jgi:hypothetical protein